MVDVEQLRQYRDIFLIDTTDSGGRSAVGDLCPLSACKVLFSKKEEVCDEENVYCYKVEGRNQHSVAFALAAYLGLLIGTLGTSVSYHIVSSHKWYDTLPEQYDALVRVNRGSGHLIRCVPKFYMDYYMTGTYFDEVRAAARKLNLPEELKSKYNQIYKSWKARVDANDCVSAELMLELRRNITSPITEKTLYVIADYLLVVGYFQG